VTDTAIGGKLRVETGSADADSTVVDLDTLPSWADPVADPFRRDPSFWRAVFASADSSVLIVVAGAACVGLGRLGASPGVAMAPFALPLVFVVWAVVASSRSSRASRVWFRHRGPEGLATWRDSERRAVASVFVHALLRNRLTLP
jgi:hypothetical protein